MDLNRQLYIAAREGQHELLEGLARQGADINARHPEESRWGAFYADITPLMAAAGSPKSNVATVKELLRLGARIDTVSAGEVTAGWYAAGGTGFKHGDLTEDYSPEHPGWLWGGGDVERLRALLDAGCDPNEVADNGRSAIGEAASAGDPERLALLIERGASVEVTKSTPVTPDPNAPAISAELEQELKEMIAAMGMDDPEESEGFILRTIPYFDAVASGCTECVRIILHEGFPFDYQSDHNNAFNYAQTIEMVEFLWDVGVRPIETGFQDAVSEAFENENHEVAKFLLEKRSHALDWPEYRDAKLISHSGTWMNPIAVKMLLDMGADVHGVDSGVGSALHYCCWQGDGNNGREDQVVADTLELLISAGADVNLLLPDRGTPLFEAISGDWSSPTSVRVLLKHGADVNMKVPGDGTALMLATWRGNLEIIKLLLAAGARPHEKDVDGRTALDFARNNLASRKVWAEKNPTQCDQDHLNTIAEAEEIVKILEAL